MSLAANETALTVDSLSPADEVARNRGVSPEFMQRLLHSIQKLEPGIGKKETLRLLNHRAEACLALRGRLLLYLRKDPRKQPEFESIAVALAQGGLAEAVDSFAALAREKSLAAKEPDAALAESPEAWSELILDSAAYLSECAAVAALGFGSESCRMSSAYYAEAARTAAAVNPKTGMIYRLRQGEALQEYGARRGDKETLLEAADIFLELLREGEEDSAPSVHAHALDELGKTLLSLNDSQEDSRCLEYAVKIFHAASEEFRRQGGLVSRAEALRNLGCALLALGELEAGADSLKKAVVTFRLVIRESRRIDDAILEGEASYHYGEALLALGQRTGKNRHLERSVKAFRAALCLLRLTQVPLSWAMVQNNLGLALKKLGERANKCVHLTDAVAAFQRAAAVYGELHALEHRAAALKNLETTQDCLARQLLWGASGETEAYVEDGV